MKPPVLLFILGITAMTAFCTEATPSAYLPVKGSAWRLAAADVNGDGANEIIYSARDGAIRCVNPADGALLWDVPLGGFAYELRTADLNGDGLPEFIAPCADGILYVLSHRGEILWTFKAELQLLDAAVVRPGSDEAPLIVCGGFDRRIYLLSHDGKLLHEERVPDRFVSRLAAGDLNGDGRDELAVIDRRINLAIYEVNRSGLTLTRRQTLRSGMQNWENSYGFFNTFSIRCADLDGDGKAELVLGESLWSRMPVMVLNGQGERLWISDGLSHGSPGFEYYSAAMVLPHDVIPERDGTEILALAGANLRLFGADGALLQEAGSPLGFTDLLADGPTLWLGSGPNGDETIYRLDLAGDWMQTFRSLERHGLPQRIGESIAALREQVLACEGRAPAGAPVYDLYIFNLWGRTTPAPLLDWFRNSFGNYDNLRPTGMISLLEDRPALGTDGRPFSGVHTGAKPQSREEIVRLIQSYEDQGISVTVNFAHGTRPQLTLETAEAILKAGPKHFNGFFCFETEQYPDLVRFYETYFGPLADLCARHGGKNITSQNKGVWWMSIPSRRDMFDALFGGDRKTVLTAGVEDSNSRTPEINLMARMGLRQAGLIAHLKSTAILDLFSATRYHEWEYPRHGHPFLRLLAVQTLLGGDTFHLRIEHLMRKGGFTRVGQESTEIIFHMLGKGLLLAPAPENMAGLSTLGIAVHDTPQKWIDEAQFGHDPDYWLEVADAELDHAVIPHNGVTWGYTRTPDHALQRVLFNKKEQFGHIPATPYGPVAIVPARADLSRVPGVTDWWHTDGIYLWRDGGPKLTGAKAAAALRESFELAAEHLPFRPVGDDVFFHTVRMDEDTFRIYAVDPGWLDPRDRQVEMKIQLPGTFHIRDLLSGEELDIRDGRAAFTVPAGCLRILEAAR